jgi:glycosyltransferase involved in cell wall biosynthesis
MNPRVTFLVLYDQPAHRPQDCVTSILAQWYRDFEVLIMDDGASGGAPDVAAQFSDPRIRYVRNPVRLGHLKNCNEGLCLARGEYLWIISSEDRLRRPYVLQRFVELMDRRPNVGLVFCPGVAIDDGGCEGALQGALGESDAIVNGREFLSTLITGHGVCAPAAMARKECYERMNRFPLDLPYAGGLYAWCFIALRYDVGYFGEPMVNCRAHFRPTFDTFEQFLRDDGNSRSERREIRGAVDALLGNARHHAGEFLFARRYYIRALRQNPWNLRLWAKVALTFFGARGVRLLRMAGRLRRSRPSAWPSRLGLQML